MDYLWHNRYVALQSGVLMKMYRERQFLGLFTVHYHYRTENRDSSLQLGTKTNNQKSQHYCLICLMKKTWKQRMYNMHAAVQQDDHKLLIYMMSTLLSFNFFQRNHHHVKIHVNFDHEIKFVLLIFFNLKSHFVQISATAEFTSFVLLSMKYTDEVVNVLLIVAW